MITAKEANNALYVEDCELQKQELIDFERIAKKAIALNQNYVFAETLHENTIKTLKKNGYKVKLKLGFLCMDPHWKISW